MRAQGIGDHGALEWTALEGQPHHRRYLRQCRSSSDLDGICKRWPWVKHLFADGAYDRLKFMDKAAYLDFVVEIIRRSDDQKGLQILPRRWSSNGPSAR